MWMLPFLAHGTIGSLDEILPIALIAIFLIVIVVVGGISRRNNEELTDDQDNETAPPSDATTTVPTPDIMASNPSSQNEDHYRLS